MIDNTKKKSSIRLPSDEALTHCVDSVCVNYTSSLQVLQDEVNNKFAVKKNRSSVLGAVYSILDEPIRSQRVFECGSFLEFRVSESESNLQVANFCKDRLCPMCNWRRSLKIFGQVSQVMNQMDEYDFLFLTLTVKNCSASDLPNTVQVLFDGWRYLYNKNKEFKSVIEGTFRSLEVTINKEKETFHPHLHCILAVKPSYFKKGYITQERWSELWSSACDLEYNPVVHVQKVKKIGKGICGAVAEVAKYSTKDSDFLDPDDLDKSAEYTRILLNALSGRRLCGWTGIFAKIRKQLNLDDVEDGDLIHTSDDCIRQDVECMIVRYYWRCGVYVSDNKS